MQANQRNRQDATSRWISLCIPTFNRGDLLRKCLDSLVSQDVFVETDEVEIVIADNCSTDDTQLICKEFSAIYGNKINYIRNERNLGTEENLNVVLSNAEGEFLKLLNDSLIVQPGSINEWMKVVKGTFVEKPIIFFTNGNVHSAEVVNIANSFDEFVLKVSYFVTWMGGFSIWRKDFAEIPDFTACAELQLIQTDVLFRLMESRRRAVVLTDTYFIGMDVGRKGGYNIAKVFGKNYVSLLKKYLNKGVLSKSVYDHERREICLKHTIPYYFSDLNDFHKDGFFEYMADYCFDDYFYEALDARLAPEFRTHLAKATASQKISYYWRQLNLHNETVISHLHGSISLNKINVGRRTYGGLTVWPFGGDDEELKIGSFVSIAGNVSFLLGGNHDYLGFSTFPFRAKLYGEVQAKSKGPIVVGDDVWIGHGSTILSGVTIGQGAIVGAGSVVTKNVAPYSIVAGNPAKHVKFRFPPEVIARLLTIDYSTMDDEKIHACQDLLGTQITVDNVEEVIARLS
jgi:acetyltransferase-like isoleucine patch superfamily enzyme